jgi:acetylserotonin N-methyltransferase
MTPDTSPVDTVAMTTPGPIYDEAPIFDLFAATTLGRVIEIALRVGMFEALAEPRPLDALSLELNIGNRPTATLLTVLAASGLATVSGTDNRTVTLTGVSREYFLSGSPYFKGTLFRTIPDDEMALMRDVHLQDCFVRPQTSRWVAGKVLNPELQSQHMHAHTSAAAAVFARLPVLRGVRNLLDVAGGIGTFAIAFAQQNPQLRCTVMDLPAIAEQCTAAVANQQLQRRITFLSREMFKEQWPQNFDAVLFSNILHDWSTAHCNDLLKKAYDALPAGGTLLINEMLLNDEKTGPLGPALFSAMMLFTVEGSQFSFRELTSRLAQHRFVAIERAATFGYYSLLTARK